MVPLFQFTLFLSALLLFWVQPMVAKMILPRFGGASAVWNTCMVFFQAALLAGYAYAHAATRLLGTRRQAWLHAAVLLAPLAFLPLTIGASWRPTGEDNPAPLLLWMLAATIGVPFFVLATSAPLLQRWFAESGHPAARDPYFLYVASNAGSMIGPLSYPFVVEPALTLREQTQAWSAGYLALIALTIACAVAVRGAAPVRRKSPTVPAPGVALAPSVSVWDRLRWIALAFVPSSLLLGVTVVLTTDVAPVPLLWVVPLALYLLTFILAFAPRVAPLLPFVVWALPGVVLVQLSLGRVSGGLALEVAIHLATFFLVALACHGQLARRRPAAEHLTEFYLWMSVGGALGGLFNALLVPVVYPTYWEYPFALVLACLITTPPNRDAPLTGAQRWGMVAGFAGLAALAIPLLDRGIARELLLVPAFVALHARPREFGICAAVILLATYRLTLPDVQILTEERNFFGVVTATASRDGNYHYMLHGRTIHGIQYTGPEEQARRRPLSYFHPRSPIGQLFGAFIVSKVSPPVGVIGLGAGSLVSYGQPGQEFTFFEINPVVDRLAHNPDYFTFLSESPAKWDVVLGDARLTLADQPDGHFGLLVIDAFNSDAIPVHLLTTQALDLYLKKLQPAGILAFNISSRHLALEPVLGNLAASRKLVCLARVDDSVSPDDIAPGPMRWGSERRELNQRR